MRNGGELLAIDLCGGAGGWACAARGLPIRIIAAIDYDITALTTYQLNHPHVQPIVADVRNIPLAVSKLRSKVDLILGGIPCETISKWRDIADHSKVTEKELTNWHRTLDACMEIVKEAQPRWWCLEDVNAIVDHLPILTPYQKIDAAGYGPQRRERVFVGEFPKPKAGRDRRVLADCLRRGPYRIGTRVLRRTPKRSQYFSADHHSWFDPGRKSHTVCAWSSRRDVDSVVVDGDLRRQLEWQEAAALQGFPDDYVFFGPPTAVGKHIGQAIQIDTGRAILQAICDEREHEA
ncbi:MAG: DNA cytosine methyltransferase [Phycisphaerales bacterium]|nr:DNA cytosine methyltransferase [Phycisphaerales bacterium]